MGFKDSEIAHLLQLGIIDSETAQRLRVFYATQSESGQNRLLVIFGVLGALLVGSGIILMVAHNWDELGRTIKTFLAVLPMLTGQAICLFTLLKKEESQVWRESSATFLLFAIGAAIALVAQIYHIPGNLSGFLLTWSLLSLPLVYLLRSSFVSLLYLGGIAWYTMESGSRDVFGGWLYWGLLILAIPHYIRLILEEPRSNFTGFHNWALALSVFFGLMGMAHPWESVTMLSFATLLIVLAGTGIWLHNKYGISENNGLVIFGSVSIIIQLFILSYYTAWSSLDFHNLKMEDLTSGADVWLFPVLLIAMVFVALRIKINTSNFHPLMLTFPVLLIGVAVSSYNSVFSTVLVNCLLLYLGIDAIRKGHLTQNLKLLNLGLGIISVLIVMRFFDLKMSFVLRGIIFIILGTAFFVANYQMLRKRKQNPES